MLKWTQATIATIVLLLSLATPVAANPFADALAAYERGDYATVVRLLRPLATQGDALAQLSLGGMYGNGRGVPQDYVRTHVWLNLSAAQGNNDARRLKDIISKLMTSNQIAEAQKLAREWQAKRP